MGPHLLQQVPPFFSGKRLDQVLLGGSQNALQADDEEIAEKVSVNVLGSAAHVILLEATDPLANGGFDLSVGFHGNVSLGSHGNRLEPKDGCQSRAVAFFSSCLIMNACRMTR
jgi:hypothetical protein